MSDYQTVRVALAQGAGYVAQPSLAFDALERMRAENAEVAELRAFKRVIEAAHDDHLATGDYARLGMAAQDALLPR